MDDLIIIAKAHERASADGVDVSNSDKLIAYLECRLEYAEGRVKALAKQQMDAIVEEQKQAKQKETKLEEIKENSTISSIINALSKSGYSYITIRAEKPTDF